MELLDQKVCFLETFFFFLIALFQGKSQCIESQGYSKSCDLDSGDGIAWWGVFGLWVSLLCVCDIDPASCKGLLQRLEIMPLQCLTHNEHLGSGIKYTSSWCYYYYY